MKISSRYVAVTLMVVIALKATYAVADGHHFRYIDVVSETRAPIGWLARECATTPSVPLDSLLTATALRDLVSVNRYVNETIKPMTDLEHWGMIEKWSYPDDGYGDCEDYALLKRRLLIRAGWPREALLLTVVRDRRDDCHAVLTIKTDRGEFILDNQVEEVLPWHETGYLFIKRQSQRDPNVWVNLSDSRPAPARSVAKRQMSGTQLGTIE